jgi:hypothetical protein
MTLLDRYLEAVRRHLPKRQRDDIVAELRETLSAQIEDEGRLRSRPVTDDDVVALLKRFGRPITVAARYGGHNYLIGPAVYPFYRVALKLCAWFYGSIAAVSVLMTAVWADDLAGQLTKNLFVTGVMALANLAVVTLVFAWIERMHDWGGGVDDWDPRSLPAPPHLEPTPRPVAVGGLCLMTFYLLVWIGVLPVNAWIEAANRWFGGTSLPYGFAPVWDAVNPLIVALMLASIARDVVAVFRPHWTLPRAYAGVAFHAVALVVIVQLLRADALYVVTDPAMPGAGHVGSFNLLFRMNFFVAAIGVAASGVFALRRLLKMSRGRHQGMMPATS